MEEDKKLIENLNKLFKSKKFMKTLIEDETYLASNIFRNMGKVLSYYITTRDENTSYTFKDIEEKYDSLLLSDQQRKNIIDYGFMTHSFNGNKIEKVKKYGLDYMSKLTDSEKQELEDMRKSLNELEKILGKSEYLEEQERHTNESDLQSVFLCSPGGKTFHYACRRSPERLYYGPLKNSDKEPAIVGEKKSTYYLNILKRKIYEKYKYENYNGEYKEKIEHALEVAGKVVNAYCTSPAVFAMLSNQFIQNIPVCNNWYHEHDAHPLEQHIMPYRQIETIDFFTMLGNDSNEFNNLDNLVTLAKFIPQDSISIVECMNEFELRQIWAKIRGLKVGDYIDISNDDKKKYPPINELIQVIYDCENLNDLEELNQTYSNVKDYIENELEKYKDTLDKKHGVELLQELNKREEELLKERGELVNRDYIKKEGINTEYGLKDALYHIRYCGMKLRMLENDKLLKEDSLQYKSDIHGLAHTRRVNFLATLIMSCFDDSIIDSETENLIRTIVNNHDIGRVNDIEDKEHGANSVAILEQHPERLEKLNDEEKEILKFVIKEHSLSAKENENDLNEVFKNKKQKHLEEIILEHPDFKNNLQWIEKDIDEHYSKEKKKWKLVLDVCKDADKLDRVRLDPMGIFHREGLDMSRLSLEKSKKFENVAYEGLDKVLRIFDIENELQQISDERETAFYLKYIEEEQSEFHDFEKQMKEAQKAYRIKAENFLSEIVSERKLSEVTQIPVEIKSEFSKEQKQNEVEGIE